MEKLDAGIRQSTQVEFGDSILLGENLFLYGGIQGFRLPFGRVLCIPNEVHQMRPYLTAEFKLAAQCLRESDTCTAHRREWQFGALFDYRTCPVSLLDAIPDPIQECIDRTTDWMYGAMYVVQGSYNLYYGLKHPRDVPVRSEVSQMKNDGLASTK